MLKESHKPPNKPKSRIGRGNFPQTRKLNTVSKTKHRKQPLHSPLTSTHHQYHDSLRSPSSVYDEGVKSEVLKPDPRQRGTIEHLDRLWQKLTSHPPTYYQNLQKTPLIDKSLLRDVNEHADTQGGSVVHAATKLFGKLFAKKAASPEPAAVAHSHHSHHNHHAKMTTPHGQVDAKLRQMNAGAIPSTRGMYIHGGVGCGKTMMMDMFFDQLPPQIPKVRKHFHSFMLETHAKLHKVREEAKRTGVQQQDPLIKIADDFVKKEGVVLCLDEFQVTDVADAMILKELFSALFAAGCVVVSTSNRHPDNLYYNGINRESFLPFIDIVKQRCTVVSMDDMVDYRTLVAQEEGLIHFPTTSPSVKQTMDKIYAKLAFGQDSSDEAHIHGLTLDVAMGRKLHVQHCVSKRIARFDFAELCDKALGAADYMAVAQEFPCVIITNIPILYSEDGMKLRRFITLLDVLYEHRTKVYLSTEAPLHDLFQSSVDKPQKDKSETAKEGSDETTDPVDAKPTIESKTNQPHTLTSNKDEVFASARALSRLTEMTSTTYLSGQRTQGSRDTKSSHL